MSTTVPKIIGNRLWVDSELATLKTFILKELKTAIVPTDNTPRNLELLTSPKAMMTWAAAFTHISITGIPGQNYEGLETLGDAYLAAFFFSYVDTILPIETRTPSYYTELRRFWLSKPELAKFADEVGLTAFIKLDPEVIAKPDLNIKEDVFEAFIGAMVTVCDTLYPGIGYIYGRNYINLLLSKHTILLPEGDIFPAKTKLREIFLTMGWGEVRYNPLGVMDDGLFKVQVLDNSGDEIANGTGKNKSAAENKAAARAVNVLSEQGISRESLATSKTVFNDVERLKLRVNAFLSKRGKYGPVDFGRLTKEGRILVELRAIQDFGTGRDLRVQLSKGFGASSHQAQLEALNAFIAEHKVGY